VGGFFGGSTSFIKSDGLLKSYFTPTTKIEEVIGQPFGVEVEGLINKYIGVSLGLRYQKLGQNTGKQQVMFADDIFTHDFQTTAEMEYLCLPAILKAGLMTKRYWTFLRFGVMEMTILNSKLEWRIDGQAVTPGSDRMPAIELQETTSSYIGGFESGVKFGKNGIFLMADYIYGRTAIATGLSGSPFHRATEVLIGYKRFFDPIKL
jgi:hypothetical protein